jgi:hypothetical protein
MPYNVNLENLTTIHGDKAAEVFKEIADRGGYGSVGNTEGQISASYPGGLDIQGALDPNNTAITSADKDRIATLAGVKRGDSDSFKTTSSAHKKGE